MNRWKGVESDQKNDGAEEGKGRTSGRWSDEGAGLADNAWKHRDCIGRRWAKEWKIGKRIRLR
jgi:hypothetical protein